MAAEGDYLDQNEEIAAEEEVIASDSDFFFWAEQSFCNSLFPML